MFLFSTGLSVMGRTERTSDRKKRSEEATLKRTYHRPQESGSIQVYSSFSHPASIVSDREVPVIFVPALRLVSTEICGMATLDHLAGC